MPKKLEQIDRAYDAARQNYLVEALRDYREELKQATFKRDCERMSVSAACRRSNTLFGLPQGPRKPLPKRAPDCRNCGCKKPTADHEQQTIICSECKRPWTYY